MNPDKANPIPLCRLCQEPRELCDSHILPNLAYKETIDPNRHPRLIVVSAVPNNPAVDKSRQTGFTERLLCEGCERIVSPWETYAANKLWNFPLPAPAKNVISLNGLDYTKFKLFLLSFVWKASISSNRFFKCVNLGPHEEKIRKMLLAQDPGNSSEYGCSIFKLAADALLDFRQMIFEPFSVRLGQQNFMQFCFRGYVFQFMVSKPLTNDPFLPTFISEEGNLRIPETDVRTFRLLCKLIDRGIRTTREWPE